MESFVGRWLSMFVNKATATGHSFLVLLLLAAGKWSTGIGLCRDAISLVILVVPGFLF